MQHHARKDFQIPLSDRRFAMRADVTIDANVRELGQIRTDATLLDFSTGGFRLRCMSKMTVFSHLILYIPGYEGMEATIIWADGVYYGCEFERPLHPAVFDHLVRDAKHSTPQ